MNLNYTVNPTYVYEFEPHREYAAVERANILIAAARRLAQPGCALVTLELAGWRQKDVQRALGMSRVEYFVERRRALRAMRGILNEMGISRLCEIL